MLNNIMDLINYCKGKPCYIQTHNFPDPDAIASAFGLQRLFSYFGAETKIGYYGNVDRISLQKMQSCLGIKIYSYDELKPELSEDDYIICVDSQKNAGNILDFVGDEIASIDHHPTFKEVDYLFKDIRFYGSCSTIIVSYYKELGVPMEKDVATALLYGLKMDTLHFKRGVTMEDIKAFEYLFPLCDEELISNLEKNNLEFEDLKSYGSAIETIRLFGKTGFAHMPFPCPDAQIAIVSDFILSLEEVEVSIIYSYRDNGIKFSVRSEDNEIDAGKLVNLALKGVGSGGGHSSMAGGFICEKNLSLLGSFPDNAIEELFLGAIEGI